MAGLGRKSMNKAGLPCFIGANVAANYGSVHEPETTAKFRGENVARHMIWPKD